MRQLMTGEYLDRRENVLLVGNSGTGKTHLATALAFAACAQGRRVRFWTVTGLVTHLLEAREERQLERALKHLQRHELVVLDSCAAPGYVEFLPGHPPEIRRIGPATAHNRGRSALLTMLQASRGSRYPSATEPTSALWSRLGRPWRSPRASSQGPLRRSDWSSPRSRGRANG